MNYTDLETSIQDYCQNSEVTFVSSINDFIISAEDKIFQTVKGSFFWSESGSFFLAAGQKDYIFPVGAIDILDLYLLGGDASTPGRTLEKKDHSFLREAYPLNTGAAPTGMPRYYALTSSFVSAGDVRLNFTVAPTPDATYEYHVSYYGKLAADSITNGNVPGVASTTTTWISATYPNILLNGSLAEAYRFMKGDPQDIDRYEAPFKEGVLMLKNLTEERQSSDVTTQLGEDQKGL